MQVDIEFSVIEPPDALKQELEKFQAEYNVRVRLREMTW